MDIRSILHVISLLFLFGFGLISLVRPAVVANVLSMNLVGGRGFAEFRIANGGFFIGLALAALIANTPAVYQVIAMGWWGAAIMRLISYYIDKPTLDNTYIGFGIMEFLLGLLLLL